jgi:hypothetical protein
MENGSAFSVPTYSCIDGNLSKVSVTPEYWTSFNIPGSYSSDTLVVAVVSLLFLVIGVPSNAVIIVSILQHKLYKTPTHILLLNLAISDFLICLLVMPPVTVVGFAGEYVFGSSDYVRCQVCQTGLIQIALNLCALYILCLLSMDRFIFIKFSFRYSRYVTVPRVSILVISAWVLAMSFVLVPLSGFGGIKYSHVLSACTLYFSTSPENLHYAILLASQAAVLATIIVVLNVWIACIARREIRVVYRVRKSLFRYQKSIATQRKNAASLRQLQNKKKDKQFTLTGMFGAILITNLIVWIPFVIVTILIGLLGSNPVPNGVIISSFFCLYLHALLHPLLEGCFVPEIKKTFKNILGISS